jgi:hypothetical protein
MYPDDCIQSLLIPSPWWIEDKGKEVKRGSLLRAYVPHVQQIPYVLTSVGRADPVSHGEAHIKIEPLRVKQPQKQLGLPVAALPCYDGEVRCVYRTKRRPLLVVSTGGDEIEKALTRGKPGWQTSPTVLAAPFYGRDEGEGRAGFSQEFVDRIRKCEYPHYLWDKLPISGASESILRLDHIQPIGRHHDTFELLGFTLSEDAQIVLDEWLHWIVFGIFDMNGVLAETRKALLTT